MLGVFVDGFSPFAPTKSERNWSAQIISTFGRRNGAAAWLEIDASVLLLAITVPEASAALRRNARLENVFDSVRQYSCWDKFVVYPDAFKLTCGTI
jgi:hypothetical protein